MKIAHNIINSILHCFCNSFELTPCHAFGMYSVFAHDVGIVFHLFFVHDSIGMVIKKEYLATYLVFVFFGIAIPADFVDNL